jgi:hypothetical protein
MHSLWILLLLMAAPFWETKTPDRWSNLDLDIMFRKSPWAQTTLLSTQLGGEPQIFAYLASAKPMRMAEQERWTRRKQKADPVAEEYLTWAATNLSKYIVVAVHVPTSIAFSDVEETKRIEKESALRVGRKRYPAVMHFVPSSTDEHLRFVFPREDSGSAKKLSFDLYVPSVAGPYREAEFAIKDLAYQGATEY